MAQVVGSKLDTKMGEGKDLPPSQEKQNAWVGTFLVVQWLKLCVPNTGEPWWDPWSGN